MLSIKCYVYFSGFPWLYYSLSIVNCYTFARWNYIKDGYRYMTSVLKNKFVGVNRVSS